MIVGFSKHGKGNGVSAINYLTADSHKGINREPPSVIVRGNMQGTSSLIKSLDFEWRYTSGVLSFAPGEKITKQMEENIMDRFEATAFAGLDHDQYNILWVRHEHAGHHELHFIVPRVELSTGKSLNIAPPGSESRSLFDTFRSMINAEFGLADPDDPNRARMFSLPDHIAKINAEATRKGNALRADIREVITESVKRGILLGEIQNREDIETYFSDNGLIVTRTGKNYISVIEPSEGMRIRLKGGIYSESEFDAVRASLGDSEGPLDRVDLVKAQGFAEELDSLMAPRERFNSGRYPSRLSTNTVDEVGLDLDGYLPAVLGSEAINDYESVAGSLLNHRQKMLAISSSSHESYQAL
jgi:hypothetical protein